MLSDSLLMSNSSVKDGLPELDLSELPPLPAFQAKTITPPPPQADTSIHLKNNSLILISLVILTVLFIVLIRIYLKLRKQNSMETESFSMSKLFEKPKKQIKKVVEPEKNIVKPEPQIQQVKIDESSENSINNEKVNVENAPIYSFKLGTPKSLSRCIKIFLEITLEK